MADFNTIIPAILPNEGGYTNDPNDSGGETYCGISRKNWPKWMGWPIIDHHKPLVHGQVLQEAALQSLVISFYKVNFWDKLRGDELKDQETASVIFDFAVNTGLHEALILAQRTLGIKETGMMDDNTLSTLNNQTGFAL